MTTTTIAKLHWDESAGATTPRGWLHNDVHCVGFYLDYGPGHYRSPHSSILNTINGPRERVWCKPGDECRACQPGDVLAVRYPNGPGSEPRDSRYFETTDAARVWVESGKAS